MFITTLPIIFTYTALFSVFEAALFLCAVLGLVYFHTPEPTHPKQDKTVQGWYLFLQSAWLGKLRLGWAFWPFFIQMRERPRPSGRGWIARRQ